MKVYDFTVPQLAYYEEITKNFAISAHRNPRFLISERRAYLWNNVRRLCTVK